MVFLTKSSKSHITGCTFKAIKKWKICLSASSLHYLSAAWKRWGKEYIDSKLFNIETTKIGMNVESNNIDDFDFSKILKAYSEGVIGISAEYKPARPHDQGPKQF